MPRVRKDHIFLPSQRDNELRAAQAEATALREELKAWKAYIQRVSASRSYERRSADILRHKELQLAATRDGLQPVSPEPKPAEQAQGVCETTADCRIVKRKAREHEHNLLHERTVRLRQDGEIVLERTADGELPDGCRIYRKAVEPALLSAELPVFQDEADARSRIITAGQKGKQRRQYKVSSQKVVPQAMLGALKGAGELEGRTPSEVNVLDSLPGCKEQKLHWDYDPGLIDCLPNGRPKPCSAIMAMQPGTRLCVYDEAKKAVVKVALGPGDILVFDGDVAHYGAWYATRNTRMHVYLDVAMVPREEDVTWFERW